MYIRYSDETLFVRKIYIYSIGVDKAWVSAYGVGNDYIKLFEGNLTKAREFYEFVLSIIARGEHLISLDELAKRFYSVQSVNKAVKSLFGRDA